ncbi:MAG: hypothetical protein FJY65_04155 [Calditrichaeota bacterium]|nr:hypothetical protein [Calditrichota bacterium]
MLTLRCICRYLPLPLFIAIVLLLGGCSEQPHGYIFTPQPRDQVAVARQMGNYISTLYNHTDEAVGYLVDASLTPNYQSILPQGWMDITVYDTVTGLPRTPYYSFLKNYLDQKLNLLQIDRNPAPSAVRHPSNLDYYYYEIGSYQNRLTSSFNGNVLQTRRLNVQYANELRDPDNIEGWYSQRRNLQFTYEISVQGSQTFSLPYYYPASWSSRILNYSIAVNDQRGSIIVEGIVPMNDRAGQYQEPHVSGRFNIDRNGKGGGDIWLNGELSARMTFTSRTFGFRGYFTLYSEDHKYRYGL